MYKVQLVLQKPYDFSSVFGTSAEPAGATRVGAILRLLDLPSSFSLSLVVPTSRFPRIVPLIELVAECCPPCMLAGV